MNSSEKVKEAWKYGYYTVLNTEKLGDHSEDYPFSLAFSDDGERIHMTNVASSNAEFAFSDTAAVYEYSISSEKCNYSCEIVKFIHYSEFFKDKEIKSQEEINKLL
jgi:hypothetical protein